MSYFPCDIPYMSDEELKENGIKIPGKGEPMTLKEAIEIIEELGIDCRGYPTLKKAVNVLLEYTKAQLSQEGTTKDAISRHQAIDALDVGAEFLRKVLDVVYLVGAEREKYEWGLWLIEACIYDIKELPPAWPEPKEGEWIPHDGYWIKYDDRFPWRHAYKCSECGSYLDFARMNSGRGEANYCPNCGAKMEGLKDG